MFRAARIKSEIIKCVCSLAKRIVSIVSDPILRNKRLAELIPRLTDKMYPLNLVENSISNAKKLNRDTLLKLQDKKSDENVSLPLVLDYNPNVIDPSNKIINYCTDLISTDKLTKANQTTPPKIIKAKRQPPNLLRSLSLGKTNDHNLNYKTHNTGNFQKCADKRCKLCPCVITSPTYTTVNGTKLKRNRDMTCKSDDLIYCLTCNGCNSEYIGETGGQLNYRMNLHRNQIKHTKYRTLKVSKHINECGQGQFNVYPFHKSFKQCHIYREELENNFRKNIKPALH